MISPKQPNRTMRGKYASLLTAGPKQYAEDRAAIRADHDPGILMFDVPPPFLSRGIDDYMATWDTFLSWSERPVTFHFHDVEVTAGTDVAFATAIGRCSGLDANGNREPLEFRLTMG